MEIDGDKISSLIDIYHDLVAGKITCEEAGKVMQSPWVQQRVYFLIDGNGGMPYTDEDMQFILMVINITQFIYNNSGCDTGFSDSTYDNLYAIMLYNGGDDVISAPNRQANKDIVHHTYTALRGTLKKIFYLFPDDKRTNPSRRYLDEWISSMESKIYVETGRHVNLNEEEIYVFPKFDGLSAIFEMSEDNELVRVLTRGDTVRNEAQDITHVFSHIPKRISQEFKNKKYGIKTEVMMQEKDFDYYNKKYGTNYKNTRSIVAAILNSDEYDPEKSELLHIVPLRVGLEDGSQELASEVFSEYPFIRCRMKDRDLINNFAQTHRYVNGGLRCDGAVLYIINPEIQKILGRENNINNFEVAYKFTEEEALTQLIGVNFTVGLFGRLTPVAKVKPVKLKGNTIENVSLGSMGRFKSLDLHKGDMVKVLYDIIPYLVVDKDCKRSDGKKIKAPTYCPECNTELKYSESDDILYCNNPACPCRIKGKILNYLIKMGIENISYSTIDTLYNYELVRSIQDIYRIEDNASAIVKISGFGAKKVNSWIESINSHKTVADYVLLGSLGIEGIGRKMAQKICSLYSLTELIDIIENRDYESLIKIPGIKDKTAEKVMNGFKENIDLLEFLDDELVIYSEKDAQKSKFKVCFTKVRDPELERVIMGYGGEVVDSLTKDTDILVVPNMQTESSKVGKAKKYGVQIVPIDDLESYLSKFVDSNKS